MSSRDVIFIVHSFRSSSDMLSNPGELISGQSVRRRVSIAVKHAADVVIACVLLLICAPLLVLIAVSIKAEDGGPVMFKQRRLGVGAVPFFIWKFRTMVVDADELLSANEESRRLRITRTGRILRLTSLDELAQLLNILRGEMSFVGPRPVLPDHLNRYDDEQKRRFAMRPGITGLAQVNGRNQLPWTKRLEYDVEYVDRFSLMLDLKIIFRTFRVVLLQEGIVLDRNPGQVDDLKNEPPEKLDDNTSAHL